VRSFSKFRFFDFGLLSALNDKLFLSNYTHVNRQDETCSECDTNFLVPRLLRNGSVVHFGVVVSGSQVHQGQHRETWVVAAHPGVLAVELEAAG
jgi:hypothetical protein